MIFVLGVPKVLCKVVHFFLKFHRGNRNQKLGKVKKFQVYGSSKDFLSKGQTPWGGGGWFHSPQSL